MQFSTKTIDFSASVKLATLKTSCVVLGLTLSTKTVSTKTVSLDVLGQALDKELAGALTHAIALGDIAARPGSYALVNTGNARIPRVLLIVTGKSTTPTAREFADVVRQAAKAVSATSAGECHSALALQAASALGYDWALSTEVQMVSEAMYSNQDYKVKSRSARPNLNKWCVFSDANGSKANGSKANDAKTLAQAIAIADGIALAKDLGNAPGNVCTPSYLAKSAQQVGKQLGVKVEVLDEKQMRKLGMGSLLSVAQGSAQPPKLIVMQYNGTSAKKAPQVLIGKGITFDTGGISIKPAAEMDEMKFDMCGAASVIGTMHAVASMKLPINLVVIVPTCENMPSGTAVKPGDIVTSMSGQTIEVLNTDAEGRLILCDAMTYASRFKPAAMIDVATLTGACVIALGHHHSGLFTKNSELSQALVRAGQYANDPCWPMPLDDEYQDALKSNFADMGNVGGRAGGSITAACFLSRFAGDITWAHLDIAGSAWKSGAAKGSSGRPVGLLTRYLIQQV